ncbi:MAG: polyprenyl synthetase family protein [Candidatus Fermentithermobacillus carboniphilus]|uniref:Polyprenyl synthetase family protein n=1 Tax=Candidatus Fermentithermobacillus carboniphilus TaxID=3085328 RepID=A0AAT9LAP3_9FIRM|nr:MAG: polyprenyl synthetase family protein [Candidatus Fermentithermobacillus carboniphilus]
MKKLDELVGEGGDHVPEELKGEELVTRAAGDNICGPELTLGVLSRSVCSHGRPSGLPGRDLEVLVEKTMRDALAGSGLLKPIMDYLMSGQGKFLRPKLVIWSAGACESTFRGGFPSRDNDKTVVAEIGAACEMIHVASLIHDDVIDGASMRRGLPAVHVLWGVHSIPGQSPLRSYCDRTGLFLSGKSQDGSPDGGSMQSRSFRRRRTSRCRGSIVAFRDGARCGISNS